MKLCLIAAAVCCLLPFVFALPIQTEEQSSLQEQQETLESVALDDTLSHDATARDKRTIGPLRQIFPNLSQVGSDANELSGAESQNNEVRVQYTAAVEEDQEPAATGDSDQQAAADGNADAEEIADADEGRNKRFLPFNLGGSGSAGGGSGGGSGNFLFDIIRQTADRAARAAGTVYRVVAGTESLGITYDTTTTTQTRAKQETATNATSRRALVAGSGNTEASDEKANSAVGVANLEQAAEKDDGYQAGVPGPITRLFVIANRGIANLMQDLILRLAQTSERIVNFKARLITSII